jgi:hypothetical protein
VCACLERLAELVSRLHAGGLVHRYASLFLLLRAGSACFVGLCLRL